MLNNLYFELDIKNFLEKFYAIYEYLLTNTKFELDKFSIADSMTISRKSVNYANPKNIYFEI